MEGDEIMRKKIISKSSYFPHLEKSPTYTEKKNNLGRGLLTLIIIIIL